MAIIRSKRRVHFSTISNASINDKRLSWSSRGILHYLLSKPDHWKVQVKNLISEGDLGRDSIYACLKQLREFGYLRLVMGGDGGGADYEVFDEPTASGISVSGDAASGSAVNGPAVNGISAHIVKTEETVKTETTDKKDDLAGEVPAKKKKPRVSKPKSPDLTFDDYCAQCTASGVDPVPETDAVFTYAESIKLPVEFLELAWCVFRKRYAGQAKVKQASWPQKFRNAVEGNWYHLWYIADTGYALTTAGQQARREHVGHGRQSSNGSADGAHA